jgi:hypothetical protein
MNTDLPYRIGQVVKSKNVTNSLIKVPPEWRGEVVSYYKGVLGVVWEATGQFMMVRADEVEDAYSDRY